MSPKFVHVTVTQSATNDSCSITVDPEPVDLGGHGNGVPIHWDIVNSPGWKFASAGIVIKGNIGGKFSDHGGSNQGNRHTWQRDNADNKRYKYAITVTDGTATVTWDPFLVNR